jgi:hypothetical protein
VYKRILSLEKRYAHVTKARRGCARRLRLGAASRELMRPLAFSRLPPQVPEPHPDIGDFWTLYDYGLDTVKTWPVKCVLRAPAAE